MVLNGPGAARTAQGGRARVERGVAFPVSFELSDRVRHCPGRKPPFFFAKHPARP